MTERRPPRPPPSNAPRPPPSPDSSHLEDSTLLAPRPEFSDSNSDPGSRPGDGIVFDEAEDATIAGGLRGPMPIRTSDVSIISAQEHSPAMSSDPGFAVPARNGVFSIPPTLPGETTPPARRPAPADLEDDPAIFDHHPATEVLRLAFSDPGADPLPEPPSTAAAPVEVRKWKMGGPDVAPPASARPLPSPGAEAAPPPAPAAPGQRARAVVALHSLPDGAPPPPSVSTRVDGGGARNGRFALDVDELRRTLEDAERLLKTVKSQAAGLDLEARGMNAQLAAALHRIGEALDLLKRS